MDLLGLVDCSGLDFNQSFLKFDVKKKIQVMIIFDLTLNAEYWTLLSLSIKFIAIIVPVSH